MVGLLADGLIGQTIAAVIGTVAFSVLFGVPRHFYGYCGMIGGIGWIVYACLEPWTGVQMASYFATVMVIVLSRICAVRERCPATIFLVSGIFPLVPGAGIYWTSYYIVTNELSLALDSGFTAMKVAVAIVLGIVSVFEIPQKWFSVVKTNEKKAKKREQ
ncbi:MAG: threonine/serine exporter family protein [bacterium]|nr:threonine/serine exporter family protein [bacterium]